MEAVAPMNARQAATLPAAESEWQSGSVAVWTNIFPHGNMGFTTLPILPYCQTLHARAHTRARHEGRIAEGGTP